LVAACSGSDRDPPATGEPTFYRSMAASGAQVDARAAATMISLHLRNNGLGAVTIDSRLMKMAAEHTRAMASRDRLDHDVGKLQAADRELRLRRQAAYEHRRRLSHLGRSVLGLARSSGHRANMLRGDVTQIGIAAAYSPRSKYKVFWALVLASPDDRRR
jgi:uncharacterized protein YkwD